MAVQDSEFARIRNKILASETKLQNINADGSVITASVGVSSYLGLFNNLTASVGVSSSLGLFNNLTASDGLNVTGSVYFSGSSSGDPAEIVQVARDTACYMSLSTNNKKLILGADDPSVCFIGTKTNHSLSIKTNDIERITINSSGLITTNLSFNNGAGIDFSNTPGPTAGSGTLTSELLNDYEEGTWSPVLANFTNSVVGTARYIKVGKLVTLTLTINPSFGTADFVFGATIKGIPYPSQYYSTGYLNGNNSSNPSDYTFPLILSSNAAGTPNTITVKKDSGQAYTDGFLLNITYIATS